MSNILIIEDNIMSMEMAGELLERKGHSVIKTTDAAEGIKLAADQKPDLILMDLNLPGLNGIEASKKLKENINTLNIPIVAFTAMVAQSDRDKAFGAGCCGFISKPIDISRFVSTVESYLHYKNSDKIKLNSQKQDENFSQEIYKNSTQELKTMISTETLQRDLTQETLKIASAENFSTEQSKLSYKRHKILIVDDNPLNAEIIKETLEQIDQDSVISLNGLHALELVEKEKFDLILLDIMMPEISGFEVIKQLKSRHSVMHIPVIFISALDETSNIVKGFNLGSNEYITKPFKMAEFKARILSILKIKDLQDQQETFMATLTHDLKTPIVAQMRTLEMLLNEKFGTINENQKSIIQETLNSNIYMFGMVNNLLAAYKYENKGVNLSKHYFNLNQLIQDCYNQLKYVAEDKKQTVILNFEKDCFDILADSLEIKRVIVNLLANAINYTEEGGKITVSSMIGENLAIITFADNGKGISTEELPNLFSKYKSYAKKFRQIGTGLGLYLSKHIIESHNGTISVESEEGRGSIFTVKLPIN